MDHRGGREKQCVDGVEGDEEAKSCNAKAKQCRKQAKPKRSSAKASEAVQKRERDARVCGEAQRFAEAERCSSASRARKKEKEGREKQCEGFQTAPSGTGSHGNRRCREREYAAPFFGGPLASPKELVGGGGSLLIMLKI